jgi:hypothetical protein
LKKALSNFILNDTARFNISEASESLVITTELTVPLKAFDPKTLSVLK